MLFRDYPSRLSCLLKKNANLRKENNDLKARIDKLEAATEAAEQYSRRNCIRVSGVPEENNENTDDIVLDVARAIDFNLDVEEIDRSHRIGKPKSTKPRDIIVKLATFRVRQRLLKNRKNLKTSMFDGGRFKGESVNEDLTIFRSGYFIWCKEASERATHIWCLAIQWDNLIKRQLWECV